MGTSIIRKCGTCGYTMNEKCQSCGAKTRSAHPMKYAEKFVKYGRAQA